MTARRTHVLHLAAILAGSGVAQLATLTGYVLAARALGVASFGLVTAGIGAAYVLADVIDFGNNAHHLRSLARADATAGSDFAQHLKIKAMASLGVLASAVALQQLVPGGVPFLSLGCVVIGHVWHTVALVPLRAQGRQFVVAAVSAIERCTALVMVLLLLAPGPSHTSALPLALATGSVLAAAISFSLQPVVLRAIREVTAVAQIRTAWRVWNVARPFGVNSLVTDLQLLDVTVVAAAGGAYQAGLFSAPARFANGLNLVTTSNAAVITPVLSREGLQPNLVRRALRLSGIGIACTVVAAVVLAVFASTAVEILLGPDFEGSAFVVRCYCLASVALAFSQPLMLVLIAWGRERRLASLLAMVFVVGTGLVAVGAASYGARGAALAFCTEHLCLLALVIGVCRQARPTRTAGSH